MDAAMFDTGVEWIGKLPSKWECLALRYLVNLDSNQSSYTPDLPYIAMENVESWTGRVIPSDIEITDDASVNVFSKGDVLFGKLRPYLAKAVRTDIDGTSSMELLAFTPTQLHRDYLFYLLLCKGFIDTVSAQTYGVKMPRTSWEQLKVMRFPCPPSDEQIAITVRLDAETGRIDKVIDALCRQIETLEAYRKSLIQEVVTHGLDPDVEMKSSGIDWIGDIPAHWQQNKLRNVCSRIFDGPFGSNLTGDDYSDEGIRVVRLENLRYLNFDISKESYVTEDKYRTISAHTVFSQDLIMATFVEDDISVCILPTEIGFAVNKSDCVGIRLFDESQRDYLHYYLSSSGVWQFLRSMLHGATRGRVNTMQIKQIPILLPPADEQKAIVANLDEKMRLIDRLIDGKRRQLETLRAQRQSLIYEYVTGKRRVV